MNYPSKINDWKTFEKNNPTICLNIFYTKVKKICPAYINSNCEKQITLLMIPNEEKEGREAKSKGHVAKSKGIILQWHYFAVKKKKKKKKSVRYEEE